LGRNFRFDLRHFCETIDEVIGKLDCICYGPQGAPGLYQGDRILLELCIVTLPALLFGCMLSFYNLEALSTKSKKRHSLKARSTSPTELV